MKQIIIILLLLCFSYPVEAEQISMVYLNDNTTTEIYYGNNTGYYLLHNNTIEYDKNVTCILIKNQIEYIDIIDDPTKIFTGAPTLIFMVIIFSSIIIGLVRIIKRY